MPLGTILAHKHTLLEAYTGFFRALVSESFAAVRLWLHPELERLIQAQCRQHGEASFLRGLREGLGSVSSRMRLGSSQAQGAGQIVSQLINEVGDEAGCVRFVLSGDGWRIYAVEVWTAARPTVARQEARQVHFQSAERNLNSTATGQGSSNLKLTRPPIVSAKSQATIAESPLDQGRSQGLAVTKWLRKMTFH